MLKGFREFISRGNVVDLAVGVVIGAAFGKVIDQLVESFLQPLVKLLLGGNDASGTFTVDGQVFDWGQFINVLIGFLLTAIAIYYFVVLPVNAMRRRRAAGGDPEPADLSEEARLLTEIRDRLTDSRR